MMFCLVVVVVVVFFCMLVWMCLLKERCGVCLCVCIVSPCLGGKKQNKTKQKQNLCCYYIVFIALHDMICSYLPTFENPKEEHVSVASNASGASKGRESRGPPRPGQSPLRGSRGQRPRKLLGFRVSESKRKAF